MEKSKNKLEEGWNVPLHTRDMVSTKQEAEPLINSSSALLELRYQNLLSISKGRDYITHLSLLDWQSDPWTLKFTERELYNLYI